MNKTLGEEEFRQVIQDVLRSNQEDMSRANTQNLASFLFSYGYMTSYNNAIYGAMMNRG